MRSIITAIALAAVTASPALARTYDRAPDQLSTTIYNPPAHAHHGYYYGADPDPRINSELRRDPPDDR